MTATTHTQTHSSRATPTVQARRACNPPQSTIPHLDIGIATHCNRLDLMQCPPAVTSRCAQGTRERFWWWWPWPNPQLRLRPWPGPWPRSWPRSWPQIWPQTQMQWRKPDQEPIRSYQESFWVSSQRPKRIKTKIRDPNTFDGSDSKKLRGFLLQCKLNFQSKPKSFQTKQLKVNYSLSFLKGTTLDYFKLYLTDYLATEPVWLNNYVLLSKNS